MSTRRQTDRLSPFHLAVGVDDIASARRFYGELLGCPEGRSAERWVDFDFFGHQLVVHLAEAKPTPLTNPVDGDEVPVPHFGLVLPMASWQQLAERLRKRQLAFVIAPRIRFEGQPGEQATMFFRDPAGNAIEIKAFVDPDQLFATRESQQVGPVLVTERTRVRLAKVEDAEAVLTYWRQNGQRYSPPLPDEVLSLRSTQERIARGVRLFRERSGFGPYVFASDDREVIGTVHVFSVSGPPLCSAQLGYGIGGAWEGQGLMREAVAATLSYAVDEYQLHRVQAFHDPDNERSERLLTRLGFEYEGVCKRSYLTRGRWRDSVVRVLFATDAQAGETTP